MARETIKSRRQGLVREGHSPLFFLPPAARLQCAIDALTGWALPTLQLIFLGGMLAAMNLSRNFALAEMCRSATADECGIDNTPPAFAVDNARKLAVKILQPLRDSFAAPVTVTSWYRCHDLNVEVSGSPTSQHLTGSAADIKVAEVPALQVARWVAASDLPFDQVIYERRDDGREWVHVSISTAPRFEALGAILESGKRPRYVPLADFEAVAA